MKAHAFDLAVVGTGVVGLAAALGAAQLGARVALIGPGPRKLRQPDDDAFDQRIYALSPATIGLLTQLRVWEGMRRERIQPVARMRVFGDAGRELRFDAYQAAMPQLAAIAEESEIARVLAEACRYASAIERIDAAFQRRVPAADATGLMLDDGATVTAQLVVAADGAASPLRAALGINADDRPYRQTAVVANFRCERAHHGSAFQWFDREGVIALLPLPGNRVSLVWSAPDDLAAALLAADAQALAQRLARFAQPLLGALEPAGAMASFPLRRLSVDRLIGPRTVLAGDAAHVVHPLAGQGLNLGLADVSELLRVLSAREPFRSIGDPVLLRRYERARAEPVRLMRVTTDGLSRLFALEDPIAREARNLGMAAVDRLVPLKNALIRYAAR